jgi:hypothetical protein
LALLHEPARPDSRKIAALAESILRQQKADGSYKVYFEPSRRWRPSATGPANGPNIAFAAHDATLSVVRRSRGGGARAADRN